MLDKKGCVNEKSEEEGIGGLWIFFFFKQKTAYEIGTGDWSSDVCSSDLFCLGTEGSNG